MGRTLALLKQLIALCTLIAAGAPHAQGVAADRKDAQAWLKKIQTAPQRLDYAGTFVYQQGNQVRTSRITHLAEGGNETEKLEVLDGQPREYIRNNEEIISYIPEERTLLVEKRITRDVFPALVAASPTQLAQHYVIKRGDTGRVAGNDAQAVVLEPKDKLRYGYRLWADKPTGLLLRAQTINDAGQVVEQIAFTQLAIGNIDKNEAKPTFSDTRGWRIEHTVMSQVDLSDWMVREVPPGFHKIREVKRLLSDAPDGKAAAATPRSQREFSQIVFSDGLAAISVFIEPGSRSRTEGSLQQGAMNIVGKRLGDFWLTIVGEVPAAAIAMVANSIEYRPTK